MMRRALLVACCVVAMPASANAASYTTGDYWDFADRIAAALDDRWSKTRGAYRSLRPGDPRVRYNIRYNASILMTHAVAALRGHRGPSRNDARARSLVARITSPRAWAPRPNSNQHLGRPAPCWATDLFSGRQGHMSLDPKVAEGLMWAWRARAQLGLRGSAVARIVRQISACSRHPVWRYPSLTGSQMNWYAEMYAIAATVTRNGALLRGDYRWQLTRFVRAIRRPMRNRLSPNLGVGYQYHYHPELSASAAINLDSPEYANIVVHALQQYEQAVRAGMRPLAARSVRLLRAWAMRILGGAWTHGGYLNWDTGLGRGRWNSAQYWAFAQQGLIALASTPRFWPDARYGQWAKSVFDSGLDLYTRLADEAGEAIAPYRMWGIASKMEEYDCFTARMLANAVRAIQSGLGRRRGAEPPPLYSFDYDSGRLAVSTPAYSTALVPFNRGAFPYGGIDPVRLFAEGQRPVGSLGGTPPQALGVVVRDREGHELLATSRTLRRGRGRPLRVTASPIGALRRPHPRPARPYAGPFRTLGVIGTTRRGRLSITAHHIFSARSFESRWRVSSRGARCDDRIILHLPTYGRAASIDAELQDGSRIRLAGPGAESQPPAVEVGELGRLILGEAPGYIVTPIALQESARLRVVKSERQKTNPSPGPTLAIELALPTGFSSRGIRIRVEPQTMASPAG